MPPDAVTTSLLRPLAEDLEARRAQIRQGGGPEKVAAQHAANKLTARERIALLIDDGTFVELGIHGRPHFSQRAMDGKDAPADGVITYVTLGALEPKFWTAFCRGVGREDLRGRALESPGSDAHGELEAIFLTRTREEWRKFASEHECCLEPVLDLDEALESELVRARDMIVELPQPGADRPVRLLGTPIKLGRTPADPTRAPGPGLGDHTEAVLSEAGFSAEEIAALLDSGAVAGPTGAPQDSFMA